MQVLDFAHQRFINRQAAGGVHQQHVEEMFAGVVQRRQRDVDRLLVRRTGKPFGARLRRHRFQLFNGGRAIDVAGHRQDFLLAFFDQVFGQLGGGGGFAGALQTGHQDHGRRLGHQIDVADALAHRGGKFFADNADQRLTGRQRAQHFLAQCLFLDAGDEVAHHGQRDVGLQQGHAHFAQHVGHVGFRDAGLASHFLDEAGEFVGKGGGHRGIPLNGTKIGSQ